MEKAKPILVKMEVSEKEQKLIEFLRQLNYGNVKIFVESGQPVRSEEGVKSTKF